MIEPDIAQGSGRIRRLTRARAGFVEFQVSLARQALALGSVGAARAALRVLHVADFDGSDDQVAGLLGVVRDPRSTDEHVVAAIARLVGLAASRDESAAY